MLTEQCSGNTYLFVLVWAQSAFQLIDSRNIQKLQEIKSLY